MNIDEIVDEAERMVASSRSMVDKYPNHPSLTLALTQDERLLAEALKECDKMTERTSEIPAAPDAAKPNALAEVEAAKVELRRDICIGTPSRNLSVCHSLLSSRAFDIGEHGPWNGRRDIVEIVAIAWLALDLADEGETP